MILRLDSVIGKSRELLIVSKMVTFAEREKQMQAKAEKEADKQRIRAEKEAARAERELKRQKEVAEREQKRKEREVLEAERELKKREKEARKQQEEARKQQVEAEKEQRRREREAVEAEKESKRKERELRRQQDEAEKVQKREEKEVAERKKQLLLQKQANIMDRLFRKKETDAFSPQGKHCSAEQGSPDQQTLENHSTCGPELYTADVISRLDEELRSTCLETEDELLRSHVHSWRKTWKSRSSDPFRRWGVRLTPKAREFPQLRLQGAGMGSFRQTDPTANGGASSSFGSQSPSLKRKRQEDGILDDCNVDDNVIVLNDDADVTSSPLRKKQYNLRWKLLQFDKSHRPAYYGTYLKSSSTVGPRHPLKKDASLDYEVDSDEEWEEEDPGESLSDCEDREEESEKIESELDEDAADGFVVPDGYLSEEEGVHLEEAAMEDSDKAAQSQSLDESGTNFESSGSLDQVVRKHQHLVKLLDNVTKHALQRNRPYLVSDLLQQDAEKYLSSDNQTERLCFQALRMCVVAPDILITPPAIVVE